MSAQQILDQCLILRIRKLSRILTRRQDMALRTLGITSSQLILLAHLVSKNGSGSACKLCDELNIEKSTMSRNLKRLTSMSLISQGARAGRRGRELTITATGRELVQRAFPIWESAQKTLTGTMTRREKEALALLAA